MSNDVIRGALKIDNFPEGCCFISFEEMIKSLPSWFTVEVPSDVTNVVVGVTPPSEAQRDAVWFKTGSNGSLIGIFMYSTGQWRQVYPVPGQMTRIVGDSRTPPTGYILANDLSVAPSPSAATWIAQQWHIAGYLGPNNTLPWYDVFDVVYRGF